jgi:CDP-paratose 2-epimerase
VYPVAALSALALREGETRFELDAEQPLSGASEHGIAEHFPLGGARTLYGATKLAAELLVAEYADSFGVRSVIDRCGVIAGPWQMGKVDQGVFTHWLLAHRLGRPLTYIGHGGGGKQVRDLLHVDDLADLIDRQLGSPAHWSGRIVNVGGGREISLSLAETTELCRELTGAAVPVAAAGEERAGDVRIYLTDASRLYGLTDWRPQRRAADTLADIAEWVRANRALVLATLMPTGAPA